MSLTGDALSQSLRDITVVDCSTLIPGPSISQKLLSLGARVVKIENPHRPDGVLNVGSTFYSSLNDGKEIIQADLKAPAGQAILGEWVEQAQVLVEAFHPQNKSKLGLDAGSLHSKNASLVVCSICGYPADSLWSDRAGHDLNFQSMSGMLSVQLGQAGLPWADLFTVREAVIQILAALRLDRGVSLQVSMVETLLEVQKYFIRENLHEFGRSPRPGEGTIFGAYPCYQIYKVGEDGALAVGAIEHHYWARFCEILNLKELVDKAYATGSEGAAAVKAIRESLAMRSIGEWVEVFRKEDCCVTPVLNYAELQDQIN